LILTLNFKPGCTESKLKFSNEEVGYNNDVYLNETMIIDTVNTATTGTVFSAPGVRNRRRLTLSDRTFRSRYSFRSHLWPYFADRRIVLMNGYSRRTKSRRFPRR